MTAQVLALTELTDAEDLGRPDAAEPGWRRAGWLGGQPGAALARSDGLSGKRVTK